MADDMKLNSFQRNLMYVTELLTRVHVFNDDSPSSLLNKISGKRMHIVKHNYLKGIYCEENFKGR